MTMTRQLSAKYRIWQQMKTDNGITVAGIAKLIGCKRAAAKKFADELVAAGCAYVAGKEPCVGGARIIYKTVKGSTGPMRYLYGNHSRANAGHPLYTGMPPRHKQQPIAQYVDVRAFNHFLGIQLP